MNLIERADQIEMAELDLDRLINVMKKSGLTYHDIIRIMALRLETLLVQFETECQIQSRTH